MYHSSCRYIGLILKLACLVLISLVILIHQGQSTAESWWCYDVMRNLQLRSLSGLISFHGKSSWFFRFYTLVLVLNLDLTSPRFVSAEQGKIFLGGRENIGLFEKDSSVREFIKFHAYSVPLLIIQLDIMYLVESVQHLWIPRGPDSNEPFPPSCYSIQINFSPIPDWWGGWKSLLHASRCNPRLMLRSGRYLLYMPSVEFV